MQALHHPGRPQQLANNIVMLGAGLALLGSKK